MRRGAGSATCSRWRTSGARSSSSGSLTGLCTWHSASSRTCAKIRQRRQHQGHRPQAHEAPGQRARGRRQGDPAARPGHPVLTGALHCCSRASPSTSSPTFNCPLPRLRRPPTDLNAATTDKDCDPSCTARRPTDYEARARRPQHGQHQQGLRSERRAAHRPQTMGPGPGLVAHVLWRYCMRLASSRVGGVRRVRLAFGRHPMPDAPPPTHLMMLAASRTSSTRHRHSYQHTITLAAPTARRQHPMTLAACNTATRHVPPALALAL